MCPMMFWSPLCLSFLMLLFPSLSFSSEWRAPITEFAAYSNLPSCFAFILEAGQATIYVNNCPQTDLAVAASCLCSKSANLASYTSVISSYGYHYCGAGAGVSEDYTSALAVVTEYCSVAPGGMSLTKMESSFKESGTRTSVSNVVASTTSNVVTSTTSNAGTVTVYTGQPIATPNTARLQTFRGDDVSAIFVFVAVTGGLIFAIAVL